MYTDVPLWGLSQSQTGAPFFCSLSGSSFPSVIHSSSVLFSSPSLASFSFSHGPKAWVWREKVFLFSALFFPFTLSLIFCIYLGIPWFIPTSPLSSLVGCPTLWCVWGIGWRGRRGPQLEKSELRERLCGMLMKGRKWWSEGCLTDGIKHPEIIKYVRYLTRWAAVKLSGAKRLEESIKGTDDGPVLPFSQAGTDEMEEG